MNKELYIKERELLEKVRSLYSTFNSLREFLNKNEKKFINKKSILALQEIKEYLIILKEQLNKEDKNYKSLQRELISSCKHELVIKDGYNFVCPICESFFGNIIPDDTLLAIDVSKDYKASSKINSTLKEVVYSDKDLIETFLELLEEIQYENDIRIYRRKL